MALRIDLTFDTRDAASLAGFWKLALGYEDEPPPAPFTTRDEWVASFGEDPDSIGPRLVLLDVPEGKCDQPRTDAGVPVAADLRSIV